MAIQLRQICLVAAELAPVIEELTDVLGINRCYVDPGVGVFGLENTLMPIGRNFLEVVSPVQENTAAGRYLARRNGDGGYMVITQADSRETQQATRQRALDAGVRVAHESTRGDWTLCQLHPGDLEAAFFEIESDAHNDFNGYWHPVGGTGWEDQVKQDVTIDFRGAELQSPDPEKTATLWSKVAGSELEYKDGVFQFQLNNATLQFVEAQDGRGAGLGGLSIAVANREHILARAKARCAYVDDHQVNLCGTRWYLHDA